MRHYLYGLGQTGPEEGEGVPQPTPSPAPSPIYVLQPPVAMPIPAHVPMPGGAPHLPPTANAMAQQIVQAKTRFIGMQEKLEYANQSRARAEKIIANADRKAQKDVESRIAANKAFWKKMLDDADTAQQKASYTQDMLRDQEYLKGPVAYQREIRAIEDDAHALEKWADKYAHEVRMEARAMKQSYAQPILQEAWKQAQSAMERGNAAMLSSAVLNFSE